MRTLKDFIERNKPVFTIGMVTFVVFALIILINFTRKTENADLIRLKDEDTRIVDDENTPINTGDSTAEGDYVTLTEGSEPSPETPTFDERFGIIEVKYYDKWGFIPKNLSALNGQLVKWTNTTENDITFTQKTPTYQELENQEPIIIKPSESFEFRLYEEGLWTYEEGTTKNFGSIDVKPSSTP